jgi:hypothetical protein
MCVSGAEREVSSRALWSKDLKTATWVHGPTGISFPKAIARFKQKSAEPFHKDGTAIFSYSGDRGVITLYLGDRSLEGFPGKDDCAPALRDNYVREMLQRYGKTDSEISFRLKFQSARRRATGVGATYHFVSFPEFSGDPAYSEIGAVLVGDSLYYYRATFIDKAGLRDLDSFLQAIAMKKI